MTPFLWIAAALALGIALAGSAPQSPLAWLVFAAAAVAVGLLALRRKRLWVAWAAALVAWCLVGVLAATLQRAAVPANRVDRLVAAGRLNLGEPLRWQGRLRDDPLRLPWGYRYEIALDQVEFEGRYVPVSGGLRLNFYTDRPYAAMPPLRAGDRVQALATAHQPRDFLDPGAFDYQAYLASQGTELTGTLRSLELLRKLPGSPPGLRERLARLRGAMLREADRVFGPRQAPVVRAMLLGDRSFINTSLARAFQKASAYHVLVIAGLHVACLTLFLFWVCRRLRLSLVDTTLVVLTILAAYVAIVQDRPPVERAALMAAVVLLARLFFRHVSVLNSVSLAAVVLLLAQPSELGDSSFQLSFLAATIIAAVALPWIERSSSLYWRGMEHLADPTRDGAHPPRVQQFRLEMRQLLGWLTETLPKRLERTVQVATEWTARIGLRLWEMVQLSLAIQLGLLPVLVADFHRVSLSGPVANIPALLLTSLIVPLGFVALAAGLVWTQLGVILAKPVGWLVTALIDSIEWFARWRWLSYRLPGPPLWLLVVFLTLLGILGFLLHRSLGGARRVNLPGWTKWLLGAALAAATAAIATYPFSPRLHRGELEVTVLDVGQGDSIFVAFPDGRTLLVDGGGLEGSFTRNGFSTGLDVGEEVVSPFLWSRGLKSLDAVELTQTDHGDIGGLPSVLGNFHVGRLWVVHGDNTRAYRLLADEAHSLGVPIVHRRRGDSFDWGGVQGRFLWPPDDGEVERASNNLSVVLSLSDGATRFLLTGGIEKQAESDLVRDGDRLASTFLTAPHNGGKASSSQEFLDAVRAKYAVISVGKGNSYGQPSPEVVERYREDGIDLWQTDRDGAVTALSQGRQVLIEPYVRARR
ncbi:MAG TPA: ComEC/Rec2 family competence protein [Patescibacteria group bacterium]|nr:ComEC/Rec2 family competence protein [Patescibacteria group bacterium]